MEIETAYVEFHQCKIFYQLWTLCLHNCVYWSTDVIDVAVTAATDRWQLPVNFIVVHVFFPSCHCAISLKWEIIEAEPKCELIEAEPKYENLHFL